MLVLARRHGESIMIGDDITVKVIEENGCIKLAIDAPRSLRVLRSEIYEQQQVKDYMAAAD